MYQVQASIFKYGQRTQNCETIEEARKLIDHCIKWLKKGHEKTIMRVTITNLETGEIIQAWSNCENKIPFEFQTIEKDISNTMQKVGKTATPPSHYVYHI